ncbi:MAG: TIGR01440 family protein [Sporolactobacillus sp.]
MSKALYDLNATMTFNEKRLLVVGCSTSEVAGEPIGTSGSFDIAAALYAAFMQWRQKTGVFFAFQCCEHLNRALVVERCVAERLAIDEVCVRPVLHAGGAMASCAYEQLSDPVVVEHLWADGGIDIGDTLIGMHLRQVAVPVRSALKQIGAAHLVMARTRPKLIGGVRAHYSDENGK